LGPGQAWGRECRKIAMICLGVLRREFIRRKRACLTDMLLPSILLTSILLPRANRLNTALLAPEGGLEAFTAASTSGLLECEE
jgi:hypothetical protein